jgi:superfamily II DNA or RNA helicase
MPVPRSREDSPVLSSYIYYTKHLLKEIFAGNSYRADLVANLSVKNPEWIAKSRFSSWHGWRKTTPEYLQYFTETDEGFYLPRNYEFKSAVPVIDKTCAGAKTHYTADITFRGYQEEYFETFPQLLTDRDKVLNVPCGGGKTILGIYLSSVYRRVTLILVPTHFLARQWEARIQEFTDATYHVWKSGDKEIPTDRDFYICSFDLFTVRDIPEWFKERIGHVILDEAHRLGAQTYLPILGELPATRRTALTATFRRDDGMHRILHYHFGEVYKMNYIPPRPEVYAVKTGEKVGYVIAKKGKWEIVRDYICIYTPVYETKSTIEFQWDKKFLDVTEYAKDKSLTENQKLTLAAAIKKCQKQSYTILDNHLSERTMRNMKMVKVIRDCLAAGRTVLFISKRKNVLKMLHKHFEKERPVLIISKSTDKMTVAEHQYMSCKARLIFGIAQLAKEGLDIDRLDTLCLHTPIKDIEQPLGRINRILEGKKFPKALYFLDDNGMCEGMLRASQKYIRINAVMKNTITLKDVKTIL